MLPMHMSDIQSQARQSPGVGGRGVITPICTILRAATGVTACDRPKTTCDRAAKLPETL